MIKIRKNHLPLKCILLVCDNPSCKKLFSQDLNFFKRKIRNNLPFFFCSNEVGLL